MALKDEEFDDSEEVGKEPVPLSSLRQKTEEEEEKEKVIEKEIDVKKKQTDNKASINMLKPGFMKEFVTDSTRSSESGTSPLSSSAPRSSETVEEIRKRLEVEEKEEVGKLSVEDFEDAADFIIDIVDMSLVFVIRWYSQDISDAEYKVPEEKLKKLKKHLSRLLMRMGKKFPMGVLFLLGVLAAYATPVRKAHEHRKKVMAEKTRKKIIKSESKSDTGTGTDTNDEEEGEPKYVPLKKRRGGNAK